MNLLGVYDQDNKPQGGLLQPSLLRAQSERASSVPNTPWPGHGTQESASVSFPAMANPAQNSQVMFMPQYNYPSSIGARFSFDENMDSSNSSPGSAYPSSSTSASSMHMTLSFQPPPVSMGFPTSCHGLPTIHGQDTMMMPGLVIPADVRPQVQEVYTAITETQDRAWSSTPATYMPSQPHIYPTAGFY
jgi:hypothetical protein